MQRSTDRILTTHVGTLQRPADLAQALAEQGQDSPAVQERLRTAVQEVVRHQADVGLDIVDDGEYGKSIWMWYVTERLDGIERQPWHEPLLKGRDRERFAEFYDYADKSGTLFAFTEDKYFFGSITTQPVCTGPIRYRPEAVQRDIANLKAALQGVAVTEAFMPVVAPASIEVGVANKHYGSDDEFLWALADAMQQEYKAIVDAGFVLQVDDAWVPAVWDREPNLDLASYRRYAFSRLEALNHALAGLPEDRVRYHICWGSWHGPHAYDIPLADIVDVMLGVHAGAYLFEAANARHEHEYHLWDTVKLPEGKILIPGVVTHSTNLIEHPELVAERIARFAQRVGKENVIAGTDCGMGGRIHPQLGWAKLEALAQGARLATKQLWNTGRSARASVVLAR